MAMMLAAALQMTTYYPNLCLPLFLLCMTALYTTHCVAYFTHSCIFEKFDVTEVQWVAIGISLVTAWKGQSFWSQPLFTIGDFEVKAGLLVSLQFFYAALVRTHASGCRKRTHALPQHTGTRVCVPVCRGNAWVRFR